MRDTTLGQFPLRSTDGLHMVVTNAGAAWMSCAVPTRGGARQVLLGHQGIDDYLTEEGYLGAIVGRYANRIDHASFELDGRRVNLLANEGPHQLHGGADGLHRKRWAVAAHSHDTLRLETVSPHGDQGYPGKLAVRVTYRVAPPWTVTVTLHAWTTAPTLCNLTSHAYFNLDGDATDIRGHDLQIHASHYLPVREDLIPTGKQAAVTGTPFDFRKRRRIGEALDALAVTGARPASHDHCWLGSTAHLWASDGSLGMELRSTKPGLQFYAGEFLPRTPGRDGRPYPKHAGLALEPQALPDSPHHPEWPQPGAVLRPGQTYLHQITYRFLPT